MITILEKIELLKERIAFFNSSQKKNEIDILLSSLEEDIKSYKEIEIYREDFSEISWSYVSKIENINFVKVYIKS